MYIYDSYTPPTREARLRELGDTIAAAILARRYAQTDAERDRLNGILDRAYNEKFELLAQEGGRRNAAQ